MAKTKIDRIDQLFQSSAVTPLKPENAVDQKAAVGIIQELLTCQGFEGLPDIRSGERYGRFDAITLKKLKAFRLRNRLQSPGGAVEVDHWTMRRLVENRPPSARASRGYLALALDVEITGLVQLLALVSLAEGNGKFSAFNPNKDLQGLSYGIIQWAQKQSRLKDIVEKYQTSQPVLFTSVFGNQADQMVRHTQKATGGVDPDTGQTTDIAFNLIDLLWKGRFVRAADHPAFQKVQVETALAAFRDIIADLRKYATIPGPPTATIRSERGYAFMIDLANQHGIPGARGMYKRVVKGPLIEAGALAKLTEESVRIVRRKYPAPKGKDASNEELATQTRRDFFRSTPLLSEADFNEN